MSAHDDNYAIRQEDFRKSWPHALAVASEEFFQTVQVLQSTQDQIAMLVRTVPVMLKMAQNHVLDASDRGIESIQAAYAEIALVKNELAKAREDFLKSLKMHKIAAETALFQAKEMQTEAKLSLSELQSENAKLNEEKLAFSKLGIFDRIFYNVMS